MSTPLLHELADVWDLQAASDKSRDAGRRETLRECADLLRMVMVAQGTVARVPVARSYETRSKAIIAFNTAKKHGGDLDDWLEAAWHAQISATPLPQPAPPVPDIPPGCQMARGWSVQVSVFGDALVTIEEGALSSLKDLEPWASTIRGGARHLLSFIGDQTQPAHQVPLTEKEFMEGWYIQTRMTLGNDRWLALQAKDVTERLHGIVPLQGNDASQPADTEGKQQ